MMSSTEEETDTPRRKSTSTVASIGTDYSYKEVSAALSLSRKRREVTSEALITRRARVRRTTRLL